MIIINNEMKNININVDDYYSLVYWNFKNVF